MNKNKYMFRIIFLTIIIVMIVTISFSYAYFSPVISKIGSNILNIKSADFEVSFATSQYFNCENVFPINNADYLTKACSSTFTVTATGSSPVDFRVGVNNMESLDPNVKFLLTDGVNNYPFFNGLEGSVSGESGATLITDSITPPSSKTYTLYVWLEDDGTDQSYYLNSSIFYGNILVESVPIEEY